MVQLASCMPCRWRAWRELGRLCRSAVSKGKRGMEDNNRSVLVVGLGRFGSSVAATLDELGQDVLAVDKDPDLVNRWSSTIPTVQADMTDVLAV